MVIRFYSIEILVNEIRDIFVSFFFYQIILSVNILDNGCYEEKQEDSGEWSIISRLALVMKSGKYTLGIKQSLKSLFLSTTEFTILSRTIGLQG